MQKYIERTIAAYNASPAKYEERTRDLPPNDELQWFSEGLPIGGSVLDAGCAYGRDTATLAHNGFAITGIDLSDGLLARAKELNPEILYLKANVCELPFDSQSFDGVWSNAVLLHLNDHDVARALSEFARVLKPNGSLFISFKKGSGSGSQLEAFTSNDERFYNYKFIETIEPMLTAAGFKVSRWRYFNEREISSKARDLEWLNVHAVRQDSTAV